MVDVIDKVVVKREGEVTSLVVDGQLKEESEEKSFRVDCLVWDGPVWPVAQSRKDVTQVKIESIDKVPAKQRQCIDSIAVDIPRLFSIRSVPLITASFLTSSSLCVRTQRFETESEGSKIRERILGHHVAQCSSFARVFQSSHPILDLKSSKLTRGAGWVRNFSARCHMVGP